MTYGESNSHVTDDSDSLACCFPRALQECFGMGCFLKIDEGYANSLFLSHSAACATSQYLCGCLKLVYLTP